MQERGENIPPEDSFEVARKVKETYCYTCSDIVKVVLISILNLLNMVLMEMDAIYFHIC